MKTKKENGSTPYEGNIILAFDRDKNDAEARLYLVKKAPKDKKDDQRKRKRVGIGKWVPAGGGRKSSDNSAKAGARRELFEESGDRWKIPMGDFHKVGLLEGYDTEESLPQSWENARLKWVVPIYETVIPEWLRDDHRPSKGIVKTGWFSIRSLPWDEMIDGDRSWMPRLIKGECLHIKVLFDYRFEKVVRRKIVARDFQ